MRSPELNLVTPIHNWHWSHGDRMWLTVVQLKPLIKLHDEIVRIGKAVSVMSFAEVITTLQESETPIEIGFSGETSVKIGI